MNRLIVAPNISVLDIFYHLYISLIFSNKLIRGVYSLINLLNKSKSGFGILN